MTLESQRIAIAEACGWKRVDDDPERYPYYLAPKTDWRYGSPLDVNIGIGLFPDYLNDLNAMHEAEKELTKDQDLQYHLALTKICTGYGVPEFLGTAIRATAGQRAKAFLRTLGKWEDAK